MTQRQKDIIIGTVLGDSYLEPNKFGSSIQIKQSNEHKDYVFWLYKELKNLCSTLPKQRKDNEQWYLRSSSLNELDKLRDLFYPEGKKIIPKDINKILTSPISLAVWFMDDGTLDYRPKDHCAFHLCTNCFTKEDTSKLIDVLKNNFGIVSSLHYTLCRGKRHCRIYIGAQGRDRFIELITPYILDCFKYKLPQYRKHTPQRLAQLFSKRVGQIVGGEANITFADDLL